MSRPITIRAIDRPASVRAVQGSYVYVLTGNGLCKVGRSKDVVRRRLELERKVRFPLTVYAAFPCIAPGKIEARAHELLRPARAWGEWCSCAPLVAGRVVEGVARMLGEEPAPHRVALGNDGRGDIFFLEPAELGAPSQIGHALSMLGLIGVPARFGGHEVSWKPAAPFPRMLPPRLCVVTPAIAAGEGRP